MLAETCYLYLSGFPFPVASIGDVSPLIQSIFLFSFQHRKKGIKTVWIFLTAFELGLSRVVGCESYELH